MDYLVVHLEKCCLDSHAMPCVQPGAQFYGCCGESVGVEDAANPYDLLVIQRLHIHEEEVCIAVVGSHILEYL